MVHSFQVRYVYVIKNRFYTFAVFAKYIFDLNTFCIQNGAHAVKNILRGKKPECWDWVNIYLNIKWDVYCVWSEDCAGRWGELFMPEILIPNIPCSRLSDLPNSWAQFLKSFSQVLINPAKALSGLQLARPRSSPVTVHPESLCWSAWGTEMHISNATKRLSRVCRDLREKCVAMREVGCRCLARAF